MLGVFCSGSKGSGGTLPVGPSPCVLEEFHLLGNVGPGDKILV
jgi:hypothetical protein